MKKTVFILGCFTFFSFISTIKVHAEEIFSSEENSVAYDMKQGGIQKFEDEIGETYTITIEEEPRCFIMATSVKNGTYKITKEKAFQWKASYKIDVSNHKIISAHSASATAFIGRFKSLILKVDNPTQATYYLKRKLLIGKASTNLRAKLSGNTISITY
ncbi:DUF5626 family protein [Carnobacterium sp.]|uniref:DUF5626 family protein n=1 Tax=Carnobacterium sp. TaxID=48221 RepID=UPI00388ECE9F